ncbi:hypothetical protein KAR91_79955 [Candidatus Pacearchaeota archaeon]|nr:hypothetical protein [Candidatus Pacearchaeota archaeon]
MSDTLWGTYKLEDPIIAGHEGLTPADFAEVRLSVGGNTALVGDFVTTRGNITAATPATHQDVELAVYVNADTQATNVPQYWYGQIIRPTRIPSPVADVDWNPDTALVDAQQVVILRRGATGVVTACIMSDLSLDVLTGYLMCIGATAGELRIMTNTFTDTSPSTAELALVILEMLYLVGMAVSVSEDIGGQAIKVDVRWL